MRGGTYSRGLDDKGAVHLKGSSGFWAGGSALSVEARVGDEFLWEDSGQLTLRGRRIGPGMQTYVPSRSGRQGTGVCHTGTFYEAEGEVLGEPVRAPQRRVREQ